MIAVYRWDWILDYQSKNYPKLIFLKDYTPMYFICFFLQQNRSALREGLCTEIQKIGIATKNIQTNKPIGFGEKSMLRNKRDRKLFDYEDLVIELMIYNGFRSCSDETKHLLRKLMITYWHIDDDDALISLGQIIGDLQQSITTVDFLRIKFVMLYYLYSESRFRKFEAILEKVLGKNIAQIDATNALDFKSETIRQTDVGDKKLIKLIGQLVILYSKKDAGNAENLKLILLKHEALLNLGLDETFYWCSINIIARSILINLIHENKPKVIPHDEYQLIFLELTNTIVEVTPAYLIEYTRKKAKHINELVSADNDSATKMKVEEKN